ncbi:MAG: hypothetical protein OEZ51_15020 [Nitrospinota bacterium]|nr:hypothetical protein [Nitrospinota bacterium]
MIKTGIMVEPRYYIHGGIIGIIGLATLLSSFLYGYKVFQPLRKHGWIEHRLVLIAFVSFIFVRLSLEIGFYHQATLRGFDSNAKYDLYHFYLACNNYWKVNGAKKNCTLETVTLPPYGLSFSKNVSMEGQGTAKTFLATAEHSRTEIPYTIDFEGSIRKTPS